MSVGSAVLSSDTLGAAATLGAATEEGKHPVPTSKQGVIAGAETEPAVVPSSLVLEQDWVSSPEQTAVCAMLRSELADAVALVRAPVSKADLARHQTQRTVTFARRREACRLAWVMLCHVPRRVYMVLSFCYRLRARAEASEHAVARRAATARCECVLALRAAAPNPLTAYDVGVAEDGGLLYRSAHGAVSATHPSIRPLGEIVAGTALQSDGSLAAPLQPPADSPFDLCPDTSGAVCYVDRGTGIAQWDAPSGSSGLGPRPLLASTLPAPPAFPPGLGYASLHGTQWHPLYSDRQERVHLYHAETGAVREAPWICLRTRTFGAIFYANLVRGETRWYPPHLWMEGWVSRPCQTELGVLCDSLFAGHRLEQHLLPLALARQRAECGAPPSLYERGLPQFQVDSDDTPDTHPLGCWP